MTWGVVATAGATLVAGKLSSDAASSSAQSAASTQSDAAILGIDEQSRQFDLIQELLSPYVQGGTDAFQAQAGLLGLQGAGVQQDAINSLEQSPMFQSIVQQGENAILQNASATGGLRGGNVQSALAQYRPQMLQNEMQRQLQNLGGLAQMGQASAAGVGSAGQTMASNIGNLLEQQGEAIAGGQLAAGQAQQDMYNTLGNVGGQLIGNIF